MSLCDKLLAVITITRRRFLTLAVLMGVGGSAVIFLNGPFAVASFCLTLGVVAAAAGARGRSAKMALVHAAAVVAALTIMESIFAFRESATSLENYQQVNSNNFVVRHPIFGFAPRPNDTRNVKKYFRGTLLYDTDYTIDESGLRMSPQAGEEKAVSNLLFFGGSFTFGEGVGDELTMPYRVGAIGNGEFRVLNLGFHGYGPQQMLAALESNFVDQLIDHQLQVIGIYQCGFFHVRRALGLEGWTKGTPRYVLGADGQVGRAGFFPEAAQPKSGLQRMLVHSHVYRQTLGDHRPPSRMEKNLFVEMVCKAQSLLTNQYPGARFFVLYWDQDFWWRDRYVLDHLNSRGVAVVPVSAILDIWSKENRISPHDAHPSYLAHSQIAQYVVTSLLDS